MLSELIAGTALAATLLTPVTAPSTDDLSATADNVTTTGVNTTVPLVRESLGIWYTLSVNQQCPDTHPYVHISQWAGSLPQDVTFLTGLGDVQGAYAVRLTGTMTNWNFSVKDVSIDLICTSDPKLAAKVPYRGP